MGALDALWHLLNFFAPALGVSALAASLTKLLWWRQLRSAAWHRLWLWSAAFAAGVAVAGLVLLGRDGKMLTYGAMVGGCAVGLWCAAFGPLRR